MVSLDLLNEQSSPFDSRDIVIESINHPKLQYPATLDLRQDMPKVWDQGIDGPCSAFAAAAIKCWQEKKNYGLTEELSPYFVYNLRPNKPQAGMYPRSTMKILQEYGIPLRKSFNPRKMKDIKQIPESIFVEAANHKIIGYAKINTIEGLKKSLYMNGPAYIALPVYNGDSQFFIPRRGNKMLGGHAAVIVGYNKSGFIIRNSWGRDWNGDGHTIYYYKDFGIHFEIWTSIDDTSSQPIPGKNIRKKKDRKGILGLFKKIFN